MNKYKFETNRSRALTNTAFVERLDTNFQFRALEKFKVVFYIHLEFILTHDTWGTWIREIVRRFDSKFFKVIRL